jgi:hypothetical protein
MRFSSGSVKGAATLGGEGKETGKSHCIKMTMLNDNSKIGETQQFYSRKGGTGKRHCIVCQSMMGGDFLSVHW